jgi:hypothetical protein
MKIPNPGLLSGGHELFYPQWIFNSSVVRTKKGVTAVTTKRRFYCSVLLLTKFTPLLAHKITSQSQSRKPHGTFTMTAENCWLSVSHGKSKNCQILQFWNVKFCMKYQEFQSSWKYPIFPPSGKNIIFERNCKKMRERFLKLF